MADISPGMKVLVYRETPNEASEGLYRVVSCSRKRV